MLFSGIYEMWMLWFSTHFKDLYVWKKVWRFDTLACETCKPKSNACVVAELLSGFSSTWSGVVKSKVTLGKICSKLWLLSKKSFWSRLRQIADKEKWLSIWICVCCAQFSLLCVTGGGPRQWAISQQPKQQESLQASGNLLLSQHAEAHVLMLFWQILHDHLTDSC